MKKTLPFLLILFTVQTVSAQYIRAKDRWGEKLFYVDGNTIRERDQWGKQLL